MSASDDTLHNMTAQLYNTMTTALSLSPSDFQLAQGELSVPAATVDLWKMMNQVPNASIAQYYDPSNIDLFSGEYQTLLSDVFASNSDAFVKAMGSAYGAWQAALHTYISQNSGTIVSNPPSSLTNAFTLWFSEWSAMNMDPGQAAECYTLYKAIYDNPVYLAQTLISNLTTGGNAAFTETMPQLTTALAGAPTMKFSMNSSTASSDLSNSWTSSSSSDGGTYFYTKSSSSEATDFTQKFASSNVTVTTTYQHMTTLEVQALATGTVVDGSTTYAAWFYPAALTTAYEDDTASTWQDPTKWSQFFGPQGALQYVTTALIVVDGISQTVTSDAVYTSAEQTYAHSEEHEDYGCWPYYVSNNSSSTVETHHSFDDEGHLTVTTTSQTGHPVIIGALVSPVKNMVTGAHAEEQVEQIMVQPAE